MGKVFLVSDTHFGHTKIIDFEAAHRPFASIEEHDEALIANWNAVVAKRDTVWHLGDVLMGRHSFALLPRLHGIKKLILGNHDQYPIAAYAEHFSQIKAGFALHDFLLTHIPVHDSQKARWTGNIHGHRHSNPQLADPWYLCVSLEHTGLAPIAWEDAVARWTARQDA